MSEALNRLDDFAKTNPKGALKLLDGFVSAINSQSDEDDMNINQVIILQYSIFIYILKALESSHC
jgi:hypothetical protein